MEQKRKAKTAGQIETTQQLRRHISAGAQHKVLFSSDSSHQKPQSSKKNSSMFTPKKLLCLNMKHRTTNANWVFILSLITIQWHMQWRCILIKFLLYISLRMVAFLFYAFTNLVWAESTKKMKEKKRIKVVISKKNWTF